jgi:AAA+ superfamily predicted ATPase
MEEPNVTDSIVVGATNHPELLDRALLRRFDSIIEFALPSSLEIREIIVANLGSLRLTRISWRKVSDAAEGLSQSEISRAAEDVAKTAILEERRTVSTDDLLSRLNERRRMRDAFAAPSR